MNNKKQSAWRRYKITHVKVRWQRLVQGKWVTLTKLIPQPIFARLYAQKPPNEKVSDRRDLGNENTTGANGGSIH